VLRLFPPKHQKILRISLPAAVNSLLDMLQVITDLIMVGRISAFAVAAVGLGLQSLMFVFAILTVLHVGTSALLSRFVGAQRFKRASFSQYSSDDRMVFSGITYLRLVRYRI